MAHNRRSPSCSEACFDRVPEPLRHLICTELRPDLLLLRDKRRSPCWGLDKAIEQPRQAQMVVYIEPTPGIGNQLAMCWDVRGQHGHIACHRLNDRQVKTLGRRRRDETKSVLI